MTGKARLMALFNGEKPDRIPWIPFAGIHAGKLTGAEPKAMLSDADVLTKALEAVRRIYQPDGMPVHFDLQVEAEVLGCELLWSKNAPPSVKTHPLAGAEAPPITRKIPQEYEGRLPVFLEAMRRIKKTAGADTALLGLVCGPFTLASHLRGQDIFMDMMLNPEYVHALLDYTKDVAVAVSEMYIAAGMDIIAAVDPLVSQISPRHFEEFLQSPYTAYFDAIRARGRHSSFFVCGNAANNIEKMCETGPDMIAVDENVDMKTAQAVIDRYDIILSGNIPLATLMLNGTQQDNMRYTLELIDTLNHDRLVISPGCDMPYDTPVENTIAVQQTVANPAGAREMVKNYQAPSDDVSVVLPDYARLEKPLVEVFTLDSASCAACTYMLKSALEAKAHFGERIDVAEYKMLNRETVPRMRQMGIKNLPTMVIGGEIAYVSLIPPKTELFSKIEEMFK